MLQFSASTPCKYELQIVRMVVAHACDPSIQKSKLLDHELGTA